jgi:Thioesterase-like superfamily
VQASFFEPAGPGIYVATAAAAGPWDPAAQHGGPPSALAAHELERHEPADSMRLARVAIDILRPVPLGLLTTRTRTLRPGKRVALLETVLEAAGQEVLFARGWRVATSPGPAVAASRPVPDLPAGSLTPRFPGGHVTGYLSQIEWRVVAGGFDTPGPCQVWARPRIPLLPAGLVPDEKVSAMSRALLVADSGSGASMVLDPTKYIFINVDLTVVLHRDPVGEWLLLDAETTMGGSGTGLAETKLSDQAGAVGTGIQTLLVASR